MSISVLCCANSFVPLYADALPEAFDRVVASGRSLDVIVSLGNNLTVANLLKDRFKRVISLRGTHDVDSYVTTSAAWQVVQAGDEPLLCATSNAVLPAGDIQAFAELARENGCRIAVQPGATGHAAVHNVCGTLIVETGSATGVGPACAGGSNVEPSLVCLIVKNDAVAVWVYRVLPDENGELAITSETINHVWAEQEQEQEEEAQEEQEEVAEAAEAQNEI